MSDWASPALRAVLREQDQATLRMLMRARERAEGPREEAEIERDIEALLKRLEAA